MNKYTKGFLLVALTISLFAHCCSCEGLNQKLLVISFDGFRQLYLDNIFLPWFSHFAKTGVISRKIKSIFPSNTFPNHWAIVTGLYAESHGIVDNSFYEPRLGKFFDTSSTDVEFWNQSEPIWQTARRQGVKKTAASFWPGSNVLFDNSAGTPDFYRKDNWPVYNSPVPFETRIDEIVSEFVNNKTDLAFLYFPEPDSQAHNYGVESINLIKTVQRMDWYLSYILTSLDKVGLRQDVFNVVVCADHGMVTVKQRLWIGNYIDMNAIELGGMPSYGTIVLLRPKVDRTTELMANLTKAGRDTGLFTAYLKKDLPVEYHYFNNDRITDIVIVCKTAYYLTRDNTNTGFEGIHGYDPNDPTMRPLFMARGPAFKTAGYQAKNVFETKDIYAIITHVIGITSRKTNASFDLVSDIFASAARYNANFVLIICGALFFFGLSSLF